MSDERATAEDDLRPYTARDSLTLLELSCLMHGHDPEQVLHSVAGELLSHDRATAGADFAHAMIAPAVLLGRIDADPYRTLGDELGGTLRALGKATRLRALGTVSMSEARRLAGVLGLDLPAEFGGAEDADARRARRLARFRELGGAMRPLGEGWQIVGRHGALADLAREEAAAGHPRSKRQDVTRELEKAATAEKL